MRDLAAGLVAVLLLAAAASLATRLRAYRRRRQRARDTEQALGRRIIAELPTSDELVLVSEDAQRVYYGDRAIDKDVVVAVRLFINGSPIAGYVSKRHATNSPTHGTAERGVGAPAKPDRREGAPEVVDANPEGIVRDRWDVAIETVAGTTLIECGAIRERVSQELARTVFEAIKMDLEQRDR